MKGPMIGWLLAFSVWAAPRLPNSINEGYGEFLLVPAGSFKMGDNFGDGERRERPVHVVDLDAYYIGKFEVTNGEWKKFRDDKNYHEIKYWPGGRVQPQDQIPYWTQPQNHGGAIAGNESYPVLGVNWDGATAYCHWLSAKTGQRYRLPTEAEWEKAARGTDQRKFPWGNQIDRTYANYVGSQTYDTSQMVGFYDGSRQGDLQTHNGASPYGVQDLAGNVMEWCQDWYRIDYYSASPRRNPQGPPSGAYRVVRGGTFSGGFGPPSSMRNMRLLNFGTDPCTTANTV